MYVDYSYYSEEYGGSLEAKKFPRAERWSEAYIRSLTYVRGDIFSVENNMVKDAVCAAVDVYAAFHKSQENGSGKIRSENNDGYIVSYVVEQTDGQTDEELLRKKVYRAVYNYLLSTGWLSRGVRCAHECKCQSDHL